MDSHPETGRFPDLNDTYLQSSMCHIRCCFTKRLERDNFKILVTNPRRYSQTLVKNADKNFIHHKFLNKNLEIEAPVTNKEVPKTHQAPRVAYRPNAQN